MVQKIRNKRLQQKLLLITRIQKRLEEAFWNTTRTLIKEFDGEQKKRWQTKKNIRRRHIPTQPPSTSIQLFISYSHPLLHGWLRIQHCGLTAGMFWLPTSGGLFCVQQHVFACGCVFTYTHDLSHVCVGFLPPTVQTCRIDESKQTLAVNPV